jgi:hypothetical protein
MKQKLSALSHPLSNDEFAALVKRAQNGERGIMIFMSRTGRLDQPVFKFRLEKRTTYNKGSLDNIWNFPENRWGVFEFETPQRGPIYSSSSHAYLFTNYWDAYGHALRNSQ